MIVAFLIGSLTAMAQDADSLFTSVVDGKHVLVVQSVQSTSIAKLANDYNVSQELIRLFNENIQNVIEPNRAVVIPLTEQNYYKNPSVGMKDGKYIPLLHTAEEGESLTTIARHYIVSETSLMRWNNKTTVATVPEELILVGWIRFGNKTTSFSKSAPATDSRISTVKQDVSNTVKSVSTKVGSAAKEVTQAKLPRPSILDSTQKAFKNLGKDINAGFNVVNERFKKLQDNVTTRSTKLTQNVQTSYAKERAKRMRADSIARVQRQVQNQASKQVNSGAAVVVEEKQDAASQGVQTTPEGEAAPEAAAPEVPVVVDEEDASSLYDIGSTSPPADSAGSAPSEVDEATALLEQAEQAYQQQQQTKQAKAATFKVKNEKPCVAGWFYSGELGTDYILITNMYPVGKEVRISNPTTGASVVAVVSGKLQPEELKSGITALLSSSAQTALGTSDNQAKLSIAEIIR
ncbi:MAG: hypothetical protein RL660_1615 [Bacteroidota bacterium]